MAMAASAFVAPTTTLPSPFLRSSFDGQKLRPSPSPSSSPPPSAPRPLQIQALKKIKGKVVCASNDKTVSVEVQRLYTHPKYKKRINSSKNYHAHDEENKCKVGDTVILAPCRPISKTKSFMVTEIVNKTRSFDEELPPLESLATVA